MDELNAFGKILITDVRDRTVHDVDSLISGKYRSSNALKWTKDFSLLDSNGKKIVEAFIPVVVDYCLNNFLEMFEEHEEIELKMSGQNLTQISDGLAGELYTEDGWIQKYTKQRYSD